jgi:hypothetical protein
MQARSAGAAVTGLVIVLLVCGAAYADNYTYRRTAAGDATAFSMTLRKADFPARLGLGGGRVKPDETADTDSCNGYMPEEHDLVVSGDAESRFNDSTHSVVVDSEVELFRSTAMAATDVRRGQRMLAPACQAQAAKQEHVKLVSYALIGHPKCACDFAVSASLEAKTPLPNLDTLTLITAIRKGRFEAMVLTTVGKATNNAADAGAAARTALVVQGLAVKAVLSRLHAL